MTDLHITSAHCLVCDYQTTDEDTITVWNELTATCPDCGSERTLWGLSDGSERVTILDRDGMVTWFERVSIVRDLSADECVALGVPSAGENGIYSLALDSNRWEARD